MDVVPDVEEETVPDAVEEAPAAEAAPDATPAAEEETETAVAELLPEPTEVDDLERQLNRDEEIERQHHEHHEAPHFRRKSDDMLMPKKVKHRKTQRGRLTGAAKGGTSVAFGDFGIQAMEPGWLTARQIEAARVAMTRHVRRGGKVWIRVFPDKPVTHKPAETRMGSGKGDPGLWAPSCTPDACSSSWRASTTLARAAMDRARRSCRSRPGWWRPGAHGQAPGGPV